MRNSNDDFEMKFLSHLKANNDNKIIHKVVDIQKQVITWIKQLKTAKVEEEKTLEYAADAQTEEDAKFLADYWFTHLKKQLSQNGYKFKTLHKKYVYSHTQNGIAICAISVSILMYS